MEIHNRIWWHNSSSSSYNSLLKNNQLKGVRIVCRWVRQQVIILKIMSEIVNTLQQKEARDNNLVTHLQLVETTPNKIMVVIMMTTIQMSQIVCFIIPIYKIVLKKVAQECKTLTNSFNQRLIVNQSTLMSRDKLSLICQMLHNKIYAM